MGYCTAADIELRVGSERYVQLGDQDGDLLVEAAFVAAAIADIDGLIDSYLASRYSLPLATVPPGIRTAACDCVVERLMLLRGARLDADAPERQLADAARLLLRNISTNKASIGIPEPPGQTGGNAQVVSGGRLWERGSSQGFL